MWGRDLGPHRAAPRLVGKIVVILHSSLVVVLSSPMALWRRLPAPIFRNAGRYRLPLSLLATNERHVHAGVIERVAAVVGARVVIVAIGVGLAQLVGVAARDGRVNTAVIGRIANIGRARIAIVAIGIGGAARRRHAVGQVLVQASLVKGVADIHGAGVVVIAIAVGQAARTAADDLGIAATA